MEEQRKAEESRNLQQEAEERVSPRTENVEGIDTSDVRALVHELEVHQVELETQNQELQRATSELGDALARYSELYDFAPVGYFTLDEHSVIVEANLTGAKMLGLPRSSLIKSSFRHFVSPDSRSLFDSCRNLVISTEVHHACELKLLRNRKDPFHVRIDAMSVESPDGKRSSLRAAVTDITERKTAEEALREAYDRLESRVQERTEDLRAANEALVAEVARRERVENELARERQRAERRAAELESFLASMADGVVLFDSERRVLFLNDVAKQLLGIPEGESFENWEKRVDRRTLDDRPIPDAEGTLAKALRGEIVTDFRMSITTPWKDKLPFSISAAPVRDSRGNIVGATHIMRDVTQRIADEGLKQKLFERERHIAQVLQEALVPNLDQDFPGCEIAVRYEAAHEEAEVGGDFYDVFELDDGKVGVLIGDVMGKGLQAAIMVAAARHSIRGYAYADPRPGRVLTLTNDALCRNEAHRPEGGMLTAFFAVIDTLSGEMTYANGGHEPALIRSSRGGIERIELGGRVIGVECGFEYPEDARRLRTEDTLVLVTDGITEARHDSRSFFGIEGVEHFILTNGHLSAEECADGLLERARSFSRGPLRDDAAIVVLRLKA